MRKSKSAPPTPYLTTLCMPQTCPKHMWRLVMERRKHLEQQRHRGATNLRQPPRSGAGRALTGDARGRRPLTAHVPMCVGSDPLTAIGPVHPPLPLCLPAHAPPTALIPHTPVPCLNIDVAGTANTVGRGQAYRTGDCGGTGRGKLNDQRAIPWLGLYQWGRRPGPGPSCTKWSLQARVCLRPDALFGHRSAAALATRAVCGPETSQELPAERDFVRSS